MNTLAADSIVPPLADRDLRRIGDAVTGLSPAQLQWVSGYIAGLAVLERPSPAPEPTPGLSLTILYGSQTGNGEVIAREFAERARGQGLVANLVSLADYRSANLKRESVVTIVVSTHGEGDPPDDAELFHEFLLSPKAPKLPGLRYAVLALGDSSYVNFCQTGREIDDRLAQLGAERLLSVVECDLDYESAALGWSDAVIDRLPELLDTGVAVPRLHAVETVARFDRRNPYRAEVLVNQKISGAGSTKDVRHLELSLEGSGLTYEPGDALAVLAENPPRLIEQFIEIFGGDGEARVNVDGSEHSFRDALTRHLEITAVSLGFLREWSGASRASDLNALLAGGRQAELSAFIDTHQVIDIVRQYPADIGPADFAAMLRKLMPRSYSIASSYRANPGEVHLTVAAVRYETFGTEHWGAASTYLADRLGVGDQVSIYIEPNSRFRLPDDDTPVIMIGPGTGVAPFRAFVEERDARGAAGKNWLFFGDRNFASDFFYQLEWQRYLKRGMLTRLDVAFSRDQEVKVYVQDRIRERAADIYRWLEEGAVIYVCGDAKRMAGDVNDALLDVLTTQGNIDRTSAEQRLKAMRREGRYQRDVY